MDSDVEVARARLGRTVGERWLLERVLGTGGMAAVYAARSPEGAVAAIKILHPEMGARREVRERFLREGWAANKIGHPGVVQMLGQGDGEEAFLAMELLEGETLRDRVRRHGRLPLDEVLDFTAEVLGVLVAAHERGVVHRDLKPDNLFVTLDNRVKVLDFGLARLLDGVGGQNQTRTGVALGTLAYMAPEQALGRRAEIDGRVDLFALGATMFRVLSGRRVHEAESEAELLMAMASRPAPPLRAVAPDVPESVAAVVDLALAFSRDARYPDARTMLGDVEAVRLGSPPPYATVRLAARDERTRPDQPAHSQRTQPLPAKPPVSLRTVPLAAYTEPTQPYPPGAPVPAPISRTVREETAPYTLPATRTEPLAQVPVHAGAAHGLVATVPPATPGSPSSGATAMTVPGTSPSLPAPGALGAPMVAAASPSLPVPAAVSSASPPVVVPPGAGARRSVASWVVGGALFAVVVIASVAYAVLTGGKASAVSDGTASALPPPLPSVAPPSVASPAATSEVARAVSSSEAHGKPRSAVHAGAAASAKPSSAASAPSVAPQAPNAAQQAPNAAPQSPNAALAATTPPAVPVPAPAAAAPVPATAASSGAATPAPAPATSSAAPGAGAPARVHRHGHGPRG